MQLIEKLILKRVTLYVKLPSSDLEVIILFRTKS